jgi:branched-chain amino acid transport system ATP-binding protein
VTALLECRELHKSYGGAPALAGVTLAVHPGEFLSIIGPNGAGKTTLVNVLTGLLRPSRGEVRFQGRDIAGLGPVRLARLGLARSFQLVSVFPALTVAETIAVAALARRGRTGRWFRPAAADREVRARVVEIAELFGLADRLRRPARTLPQGDKKLLDVASAFALDPTVILMDEPTSGVSTAEKTAVMDTLVRAAGRVGVQAIVQVEHDMDIVFAYSDRIVALHQGRVLADGRPEAIRADAEVVATVIGQPR